MQQYLKTEKTPILIFSDYGSTEEKVLTYSFLIISVKEAQKLYARLGKIRSTHKIQNRTIEFKRRKNYLNKQALKDWIAAFKQTKGILFSLAMDKRSTGEFIFKKKGNAFDLEEIPSGRMLGKMMDTSLFFACTNDSIPKEFPCVWISDRDEIVATPERISFLESLLEKELPKLKIVDRSSSKDGAEIRFYDKDYHIPEPMIEDIISIADLATSTLSMKYNFRKEHWDTDARKFMTFLDGFRHVKDDSQEETGLVCDILRMTINSAGTKFYRHRFQ